MPPKKATATTSATRVGARTRKPTTAPVADEPVAPKAAAATKKTTTAKAAGVKKATTTTTKKATATATAKAAAAKKPAAKKTAAKKSAPVESDKENQVTLTSRAASKRKRDEDEEEAEADQQDEVVEKKAKPAPRAKRVARELKPINNPPTQVMDIFVFGEGTAGELGLGAVRVDGKKPIDVKRPRFNSNLKGVVQVACGGMHVAALTNENKILTWGVNDQGALGRDTTWDGGVRDVDDEDESDDEDDTGMNPKESTPGEVDMSDVPPGTTWVQLVASDSATFALTTTGLVYGWGTFRSNEGVLGFSRATEIQRTPTLVPEISKIKQLAAGLNHIIALDEKNKIYAWGAGQQAQLARRLLERDDMAALYPTGIGALPGRAKAEKITCGSYHCFVIDSKARVISWGLNNYAECGLDESVGVDGGYVMRPQIVSSLSQYQITDIAGGEHHSLACTSDGQLLTWGRIDGHQVGQPSASFSEDNTVWDERNQPRILTVPSPIPGIKDVVSVAAGTDHSFAITREGKVYSWGFSGNYQTGQGTTDDIETPELIDNSAIRDRKIIFAGAGGQYGIVGALPVA
ncbi:regulator of chromosome condensation 1/beta-lactamase-inhibitor protein II [Podospora fimiseda]|uniref:Regulator of chromosome condensation 1/beta-lactamase-inhibitor protein II n=1 Tax=Podospora fimiseda TaxID=252190 RepID=A0AAN7BV28_9PEZI|nr:regulator of chromosome condensation 1/beta-lactamase-inhibitor protein II [Podospora fimiseda]